MRRARSFRARLVVTMILLVAGSIAVVGVATYVLVSRSLSSRLVDEGVERATFNIGVLADDGTLAADATADDLAASGLPTAFLVGGASGVYVDFGPGRSPYASSTLLLGTPDLVDERLVELVARGELAHEYVSVGGRRTLVVAGRRPPAGPDFYFYSSASSLDEALRRLRQVLFGGGAVVLALSAGAAVLTGRRVLRPVATAGAAAHRMAGGDLDVRLPVESADEFGSWAESFNDMAAALQSKIGELEAARAREQRFVADVSHELRTPLTALVNEAALLRDHLDRLPVDIRRVGDLLVGDVERLRRLVEDLLEVSRLEAGVAAGDHDELDLGGFLQAVVAARHPDADLSVAGAPIVAVDRRGFERIVGNLLDNARSHAAGSAVAVTAAVAEGVLVVTVADRGPGVPAEQLDHLFDRFYKADASRGGAGTGLGLAIAREHVLRMGGTLTAATRSGGGLAFTLTLPVTELLPAGDAGAMRARHSDVDTPEEPT